MDFLLFLRSIKMNRPYAVHPNKNADVNLGIKYSLLHVKSAVAFLILMWECCRHPASLRYSIQRQKEISIAEEYIDSSNVCYQIDSNRNKNYDIIQYWEKMVYLDEETYSIKRCILSVPDRRVYQYDCTAYDYDGGEIESRNLNGTSRVIVAGSMGEREMRIVRDLAR